jgi:hypothetical protein
MRRDTSSTGHALVLPRTFRTAGLVATAAPARMLLSAHRAPASPSPSTLADINRSPLPPARPNPAAMLAAA